MATQTAVGSFATVGRPRALCFWLAAACGQGDPSADALGAQTEVTEQAPAETFGEDPEGEADVEESGGLAPRAAFEGDAIDRELEILDATHAESPDDFLLDLPGSAGLTIDRVSDAAPGEAQSVGKPQRGRLRNGVALPPNLRLYTRRNPSRSFGSKQTIRTIQTAMETLRERKKVHTEVLIGDISSSKGGPLPPHASHQSGRDIDIRLVLAAGLERDTVPVQANQVDWDATWQLVHSFLETGRVTYVFLGLGRQGHLHAAALRAGVDPRVVDHWFQWPGNRAGPGIIRHEDGHRAHVHIRLACAPSESHCTGL